MMMTISVILTACGTPVILMITIIKAEANVQLFVWFFCYCFIRLIVQKRLHYVQSRISVHILRKAKSFTFCQ